MGGSTGGFLGGGSFLRVALLVWGVSWLVAVGERPAPGEAETARLVRRSWHAARALAADIPLSESDVMLSRPADGLAPADSPVGRVLTRTLATGAPIRAEDLLPDPA